MNAFDEQISVNYELNYERAVALGSSPVERKALGSLVGLFALGHVVASKLELNQELVDSPDLQDSIQIGHLILMIGNTTAQMC